MPVTKQQQAALTKLARAANRRLERATEGQRKSLEHNIEKYHTQRSESRGLVFQQGKAKNEREYRQRMAELNAFMKAKTSTRKGWEELRKSNLKSATESLTNAGYDITDEELDIVLQEIGGSSKAFYRVLENIQAMKEGPEDELSAEEVRKAINDRRSDYKITLQMIQKRKGLIKRGIIE